MIKIDLLPLKKEIIEIYVKRKFNVRQTSEELLRRGYQKIGTTFLRRFLIQENLLREKPSLKDEKKREELDSYRSEIEDLYLNKLLPASDIKNYLLERNVVVSTSMIREHLIKWGINRTLSKSNKIRNLKNKKCCACQNEFKPRASHQFCCQICVPFTSQARGRWNSFRMTQQMYDDLWNSQNGQCVLCFKKLLDLPSHLVHLDHCHKTNRVRGILCAWCNRSIAIIERHPGWGFRAENYLVEKICERCL